jgi:hypothetical protein
MNRIAISALGILAIAGALYRPPATDVGPMLGTELPKASRAVAAHQQRGSAAQPEAVTTNEGQLTVGRNPCSDISGPWDIIPEFFGEVAKNEQGHSHFQANLEDAYKIERDKQYELQYLIATLADPIHTNLELYFDRGIEAILRAADESGYDFDRYWLPWSSEALPEEPNCYWRGLRDRSTEKEQRMPGLLLFRQPEPPGKTWDGKPKPPRLLFVFLVAETPTSGIKKEQFANAVRYIQEIQGTGHAIPGDAISVLGPTFSGSVDSFVLAVNAAESQRVGPQLKFRVSSGSTTSPDAVDRLRTWVECGRHSTCIEAGTTLADDQNVLTGIVHFLQRQGTQPTQVALVTEEGTTYGERYRAEEEPQPERKSVLSNLLVLHFPRKMASLRQAYQANPQVGALGASQQVPLPHQLLPLSLTESAQTEEDAVPVYSKQQTPVAQESQVIALAATLREKNIKYAGIMATDPLDTTFLIRFLHRTTPDVRLFVPDPDLLFLRALEGDTAPLGLLAVSSYPILTASQAWLSQASTADKNHPTVFTNEYAEATYNSCLLLLRKNKARAPVRDANPVFPQPNQASDLSLNPPLWLMMAGHTGYWPVRLLDDHGLTVSLANEKLTPAWLFVWVLVSCLALCQGLAIILTHCANYRWLEQFRLSGMGGPLQDAEKASCLLIETVAMLAIEGLLLYAPRGLKLLKPWQVLSASLVTALLLLTALSLLRVVGAGFWSALITRRSSASSSWHLPAPFSSLREKRKRLWYLLLAVFVVAAFCLIKPWSWPGVEPYTSFFWYRSIHLTSGVSPAVPFCMLLGALYAWAWSRLKCTATAAQQPSLWPSILLKPFVDADKELRRGIGRPLFNWKIAAFLAASALFGIPTFHACRQFATPESSLFSEVYTGTLALLLLLVFINWGRFLVIWHHFRRVLEGMDQVPLRGALRRLPVQYSWSPIWEHGGTRQSYEILIRWFDNLQNLASVAGSGKLQEYFERNSRILRQIAAQLPGEMPAALVHELQAGLLNTTRFIEQTYLRPEWAKGKSDSLGKEAQASLTQESREEEFWPNKKRILAEESLSLYYLRYVRNVCLYMRYVLFFVSAGFILALISLKCYPFQPEHTISLAVTVVFAVLGIGVIKVFVEMEKDPVLSCLADTQEGKLSGGFYLRLISYGALPVFTFIAAQFPSVARFFFSWIQPSLNAFR